MATTEYKYPHALDVLECLCAELWKAKSQTNIDIAMGIANQNATSGNNWLRFTIKHLCSRRKMVLENARSGE